jgi:hypothetical protein
MFALAAARIGKAEPGRATLPHHVPAAVAGLTPKGDLPATNTLRLAIGLPLRNQPDLDALLQGLYDPASPNYQHYLTPEEFTGRLKPMAWLSPSPIQTAWCSTWWARSKMSRKPST